jgi:hypothetical protein
VDTILGSFERNFPWDVAEEYDILTSAPSAERLEQILLYMVGHMSFLKTAPHVVGQFLLYPAFMNMKAFLDWPLLGETAGMYVFSDPGTIHSDRGYADEGEWSHHVFMHTNLTFLRFPGMVGNRFHMASPTLGTFSVSDDYVWNKSAAAIDPLLRAKIVSVLQDRQVSWVRRPTFSSHGKDHEVELREAHYEGPLWFSQEFAVDMILDPNTFPSFRWRRFA